MGAEVQARRQRRMGRSGRSNVGGLEAESRGRRRKDQKGRAAPRWLVERRAGEAAGAASVERREVMDAYVLTISKLPVQ